MRKSRIIIILLIVSMLLGGCGYIKVREEGSAAPDPTNSPAQETTTAEPTIMIQNP